MDAIDCTIAPTVDERPPVQDDAAAVGNVVVDDTDDGERHTAGRCVELDAVADVEAESIRELRRDVDTCAVAERGRGASGIAGPIPVRTIALGGEESGATADDRDSRSPIRLAGQDADQLDRRDARDVQQLGAEVLRQWCLEPTAVCRRRADDHVAREEPSGKICADGPLMAQ